jgi:outer membrane protein
MIIKKRMIKIVILLISSIISTHAIVRMHHQPEDQNATDLSRIAAQDDQPIPQQDTAVSEPPAAIAQEPVAQPTLPEQQEVKEPEPAAPAAAIAQEPPAQPTLAEQQEVKEPESAAPEIAHEPAAQPAIPEQQKAKEPESTSPAPEIAQEPAEQPALPEQQEVKEPESTFLAPAAKPAHKPSYTDSQYKWKTDRSASLSRASAKQTTSISSHADYRYEAKVRGSAFIPRSDLFRAIYGTAVGNFDGEIAVDVYKYLQVWLNIDYTQAHGKSLGFCDPTKIWIVNGSLGLKTPFDINDWFRVYLGLGPTFGAIRIKDESQFSGCVSSTKSSIGFVAKSGMNFYFSSWYTSDYRSRRRCFVDIFADYVYQKADFEKDVNASGLRVGAGIGAKF